MTPFFGLHRFNSDSFAESKFLGRVMLPLLLIGSKRQSESLYQKVIYIFMPVPLFGEGQR
jgi:hypothetical protein